MGCCETGWGFDSHGVARYQWLQQCVFQDSGQGLGCCFTVAVSAQRDGCGLGAKEWRQPENAQCSSARNGWHESSTALLFRSPCTRQTQPDRTSPYVGERVLERKVQGRQTEYEFGDLEKHRPIALTDPNLIRATEMRLQSHEQGRNGLLGDNSGSLGYHLHSR